jgi:hypothetical protein
MEPTDAQIIRAALDARLLDVHTSMPAVVRAYNPALQTVDAEPVIKRAVPKSDGSTAHEKLPVVYHVPVCWIRGGGFSLQFPLAPGDHVLLNFSEAATAQWRATGQISEPGDLRRHELSYAFAHPGIAPVLRALLPPPPGAAKLETSGDLHIGNPLLTQYVALANLVSLQLEALKTAIGAAATIEGNASGLGGMTALNSELVAVDWPGDVASDNLRAQAPII